VISAGWRSAVWWVAIAVLCALLAFWAFRSYLNPGALIDFANSRLC